ncbi:MAG: hypothetical protein GXP53_09530 [Deltaproteobacteria bacterium]|nr:hypothetical protein [Deltaproteobacteria bacterium]
MSFMANLKKKIMIDRLAERVIHSLGPVGSGKKIDRPAMRTLLEIAGYHARTKRFTEMYAHDFDAPVASILVLDNELKIFKTSFSDVLVRKSPIIKEMLNIRNIRKILNDTDVVIAKRADAVEMIRTEGIAGLDLSYTPEDIEKIYADGCIALDWKNPEDVEVALELFAELLGLTPPPVPPPGILVFGQKIRAQGAPLQYGPVILYIASENRLNCFDEPLTGPAIGRPEIFEDIAFGETAPDLEGEAVFAALKENVLALPRPYAGS